MKTSTHLSTRALWALIAMCTCLYGLVNAQNIGINSSGQSPNENAMLDVSSSSMGVLVPRMTTTDRTTFAGILDVDDVGMLVFDISEKNFYFWNGSEFLAINASIKEMSDADQDTRIQVEKSPDEDKIRFEVGGDQRWLMIKSRFQPLNTGNSVFIGTGVGNKDDLTDNRNTAIGSYALNSSITGVNNTAVGYEALKAATVCCNVAVGYQAMTANFNGSENSGIGYQAMFSNISGYSNSGIGHQAMYSNTSGFYNSAVGHQALYSNDQGFANSALGLHALYSNSDGDHNSALGYQALKFNDSGNNSTAMGSRALYKNDSGNGNSAFGYHSLEENTTGKENTAVGKEALNKNTTGENNTAVGHDALYSNSTGKFNTAVGYTANNLASGYDNTTSIGFDSDCTASNQIRIGNNAVTSIGGFVNWSNLSDGRFKSDIRKDVPGLDFVLQLDPVTYFVNTDAINDFMALHYGKNREYDWEGSQFKQQVRYSGFVAQDVEAISDSMGYDFSGVDRPESQNDFYALRYAEFVVPLVKAVQEQQAVIETLQSSNDELNAKIDEQDAMLRQIISRLNQAGIDFE